ncbi:MAG: hypothetical protein H0T53_15530 [Herpetosiphonaceae bacterium]|nr:hypothetical protein [Herpetosiphonaceae bacterium]
MATDIGEHIVGAYLKLIKHCDIIDYNARTPGGGLVGLNELDVIGLDFKSKTAYLCEVTTHLNGMFYGTGPKSTIERIQKKYAHQRAYAASFLDDFPLRHYMFWSPYVPDGSITNGLRSIDGLEVVINKEYTDCVRQLQALAKKTTHDTNNPFFRVLQILEHLR